MASMALSMVVLGAIVIAVYGIAHLLYGSPEDNRDVDYESVLVGARATDDFAVLAPPERPEGWRANHADFVPGPEGSWRLGLLTDQDRYIGLNQVFADVEEAVEEYAPESEEAGETQLAGQTWQVFEATEEADTTFVRGDGENRVVLVTGTAPREQIETYIESLTTE